MRNRILILLAAISALALLLGACHAQSAGQGSDDVLRSPDVESPASAQVANDAPDQAKSAEDAPSAEPGANSEGGWESPFEGLDRPVSELEVVEPGVAKDSEGGMLLTEYLAVWFHGSYDDDCIREVIAQMGCEEVSWHRSRALDHVMTQLKLPEGVDLDDEARAFLSLEEVEKVSLVAYYPPGAHAGAFAGKGDLSVGDSPDALTPDYGMYYLRASRFNTAYASAMCNGNVTVAVLDSGAPDPLLSEVADNVDYDMMYDATGGDGYDTYGHGTKLASVISALAGGDPEDDDPDIDGASWNASIVPIRIYTDGAFPRSFPLVGPLDLSALWDGFEYLLSLGDGDFPDVVNMSFGLDAGVLGMSRNDVVEMQSYIDSLVDAGAVCVAAAGNDGADVLGNQVHYPAACEGVISVGDLDVWPPAAMDAGVDYDPVIAARSNTASDVDICAHGEDIKVIATSSGGGYTVEPDDGTSYAAALVSSAAALVKAAHPGWGPDDIEDALEAEAVKVSAMNGLNRTDAYGYGALDVAAAVNHVISPGGSGSGSGGGTSYFTGPSDGLPLDDLQASYQESLQRTALDAIPSALGRAMELNPDVFGWLYVPGTSVSAPVALGEDGFYLTHDLLGNESAIGCAFATSSDAALGDAVTVVYGHSFASGDLAFTSLHTFEDAAFFAGHDRAYVYLPGRRLEYRVVGAYLFNARAIEGVDQSDPADLGDYFAELSSPDPSSFVGCKRRGALDPGRDRVLQLSTCTVPADPALRFVVTCVYAGEEGL